MSRCGSTLFANALRQIPDSVVVSERQALNAVLTPVETDLWPGRRSDAAALRVDAIRGAINAFSTRVHLWRTRRSAANCPDDRTIFLNYQDITAENVCLIDSLIRGVQAADVGQVGKTFSYYAKDASGTVAFTPDAAQKRSHMNDEVLQAVRRWAQPALIDWSNWRGVRPLFDCRHDDGGAVASRSIRLGRPHRILMGRLTQVRTVAWG